VNVYAPPDRKLRAAFMSKLDKYVNKRTILTGDFNCVLDISLDVRRPFSNTPYENAGSFELNRIVEKNELTDEIRMGLGLGFEFTREHVHANGVTQTRIDASFLPIIPDTNWTSEIKDALIDSDHSSVISTMEFRNEAILRGRDLVPVNENLILVESVQALITPKVDESILEWKSGRKTAVAAIGTAKYEVRKILRKATRQFRKKCNVKIAEIELKLQLLHEQQLFKPTKAGKLIRNSYLTELSKTREEMHPPKARGSRHTLRKEECMSREFWQRVFRSQGSSNFINSLNRVDKWDNPPGKNETGLPQSTDVCGEGAKYFSHLGEAEESEPTASKTLTDLLSAGATVNKKTADMVGADFTVKEVESIASHVPLNKSPGPDRIPNGFWRSYSKKIAPLLTAMLNECKSSGEFPEGINDGIVATSYIKREVAPKSVTTDRSLF